MIINILCSYISLFPQRRRKSAQSGTETDTASCQDPSESCQLPSASQPQALLLLLAIKSPLKLRPKRGKFGFLNCFWYKCCSEIHQSLLLVSWDLSAALSGIELSPLQAWCYSSCLGSRLNLLKGNLFLHFSSKRIKTSHSLSNVTSWEALQHTEVQAADLESLGSCGSTMLSNGLSDQLEISTSTSSFPYRQGLRPDWDRGRWDHRTEWNWNGTTEPSETEARTKSSELS